MNRRYKFAQELRNDLSTLAGLAHQVGRWDGISEVGEANVSIREKSRKAFHESEDYLDELVKKYADVVFPGEPPEKEGEDGT